MSTHDKALGTVRNTPKLDSRWLYQGSQEAARH